MNILVAGSGSIGKRHIYHLSKLVENPTFTLIRHSGLHDTYSKNINSTVISSIKELNASPDLFVIASPSACHLEHIKAGLELCIPMYVEKPLVASKEQISSLTKAIQRTPNMPITQFGCNLRFLPSLCLLKKLLSEGKIGRVVRASFEAGQWLPDWRPGTDYKSSYSAHPYLGGGVCLDLMHEIDMALWLLGPMRVLGSYSATAKSLDISSESVSCSLLKTEDNAAVQISLDYVARVPLRRYTIVGEAGTLIWDLYHRELLLQHKGISQALDLTDSSFDIADTYRLAHEAFLASVFRQKTMVQPISEGIASTALALEIRDIASK